MAATTKALLIKDFVLSNSSLIEASAGTGKTFTITYLVLRLLLGSGDAKTRLKQGPLDLDQILIVTFTRAAASDLRKRIRENIRQAREAFDEFAKDPKYRAKDEPLNDLLVEMQEKGISPGNIGSRRGIPPPATPSRSALTPSFRAIQSLRSF